MYHRGPKPLWRAVAACARAWQRSLAWAPRLALHLVWHHAWVAVARMAHAGMRGCRQALEKSGYAQGLWYVRRRVGCAVFARWTQCLRSMYQQPDGSPLSSMSHSTDHPHRQGLCVCSNDLQTIPDDTCTTRRAIPPAAAALQPGTRVTPASRQFRFPVCLLSTDMKIGVAYLGDEPRNQ